MAEWAKTVSIFIIRDLTFYSIFHTKKIHPPLRTVEPNTSRNPDFRITKNDKFKAKL